jgi:hypothetical protein
LKKVLYIIYYWPPCGGASVLRTLKFVKYLGDFGWKPVVFAPENANYPVIDETTLNDIPPGTEVIKLPIVEPFGIFNILKGKKKQESVKDVFLVRDEKPGLIHNLGVWVRGNFFIPDARMLWIKPSVKHLRKYLQTHKIDAIISSGPPHSVHRIAYKLKKEFDIPWIADFQDPWTQIDYFEKFMLTDFARKKHIRHENEVLQTADKVVIVSPSWSKDLSDLGGGRPVNSITMGYDEAEFPNIIPDKQSKKFTISHYGTLGIDRNPDELWRVLSDLSDEIPSFRASLQIVLAGVVDYSIFQGVEKAGLKENLQYNAFLTKDKVVESMLSSDILLLLLNKGYGEYNVKGRIPGKVFEYLGCKKQILVIGEHDSDVAAIVSKSKAGITVGYDDYQNLKKMVVEFYKAWQQGKQLYTPVNTSEYTFKHLAGKLAGLLDEIAK